MDDNKTINFWEREYKELYIGISRMMIALALVNDNNEIRIPVKDYSSEDSEYILKSYVDKETMEMVISISQRK